MYPTPIKYLNMNREEDQFFMYVKKIDANLAINAKIIRGEV